jgi:hypothetical protein
MVHSLNPAESNSSDSPKEVQVKKKSTKKQTRRKQDQHRRREAERKHRQATEQAEAQLWRELEPRVQGYNLDDDDEFIEFASHAMHDSAVLYGEPEFQDLAFDPAEAMLAELGSFNATVPAPEKLERMPEEEHQAILEDAQVHAVSRLVTPGLQRDLLKRFKQCRQRLKREREIDQLALASAAELVLRGDSRPIIWATCGILHRVFNAALETAFEFQKAEEEALQFALAIQPDITEAADLEENSPAYRAFWEAAAKTPGLTEYLERAQKLGATLFEAQHELNAELGMELFDPEEIEDLVESLVENLKTQGVDLSGERPDRSKSSIVESTFSDVLKAQILPERFQELVDDLAGILEEGDEMDEVVRRAQILHDELAGTDLPYWENPVFQKLCLDVMVADVLGSAEEDEDDQEDA